MNHGTSIGRNLLAKCNPIYILFQFIFLFIYMYLLVVVVVVFSIFSSPKSVKMNSVVLINLPTGSRKLSVWLPSLPVGCCSASSKVIHCVLIIRKRTTMYTVIVIFFYLKA